MTVHILACLKVYMSKSFQWRRRWFPATLTHSIHAAQILFDSLAQETTPYRSLQVHLLTRQVPCGTLHGDSSWILLAVRHSYCLTKEVRALETFRACISQGWPLLVSVIPAQCTGVLLWKGRYRKGAFSLWDCFPIRLGQMTVPVTPAGTLLRLSLHILPLW